MLSRKLIISVIIIVALFSIAGGCKKSSSVTITGGGKGGTGSVWVTPTHGNTFVDSCTVYIKYGTLDAPANGIYDDSAKCKLLGDTPVAIFDSLTTGLYYFYGVGYHQLTKLNVRGAANCTMTTTQKKSLYLPTYSY